MISDTSLTSQLISLKEEIFELNKLFELGGVVNQSINLTALSTNLVNYLKKSFQYENVYIFYQTENTYKVLCNSNQGFSREYCFENSNEGIWKELAAGKPVKLTDKDKGNIYPQFFEKYNLEDLQAVIWMPLVHENEIIAIISLGAGSVEKDIFSKETEILLKISDYISPVFKKFIIQKEREDNMNSLQKSLHNLSILYNIGQAMNFIDDLKGLLKIILDKAIKTINAEKGSLMLYDYTTNELVVKVVYGLEDKDYEDKINEGIVECTKIRVGEGIAGNVFIGKKAIITNTV
jgi:transcriptional regulator with GAF, ATPase, and Fis domain